MGCQKKIAEQIIQQEGDYVLSLKGNHGLLHEDVTPYFESSLSPDVTIQTVDGDHGRVETRTLRVSDEINWLEKEHSWTGLKSILAVTAKREIGDKVTEETRYFISSLSAGDPEKLERAVRAHWSIEHVTRKPECSTFPAYRLKDVLFKLILQHLINLSRISLTLSSLHHLANKKTKDLVFTT